MKTFKQFLVEGVGEDMEVALISYFNSNKISKELSGNLSSMALKKPKYLQAKIEELGGISNAIAQIIETVKYSEVGKKLDFNSKAYKPGPEEVTEKWKSWGSVEKTPKTDIVFPGINKPIRISLKTGDAQLMSGQLHGDAGATFKAALNNMNSGTRTKIIQEAKKIIETIPQRIKIDSPDITTEKALLEPGNEQLKKINEKNKELSSIMKQSFSKNDDFRFAFVKEAITGEQKFGTDKIAYAEYVLCCSLAGYAKIHKADNSKYIDNISKQVKIDVSFKTNSIKRKVDGESVKTGRVFSSCVRVYIDGVDNMVSKVSKDKKKVVEKIEKIENNNLLNENQKSIMIEGIWSDFWNKVKTFISEQYEKIAEKWNNMIDSAMQWIGDSIEKLLEFLGFEVENVEFTNSGINWLV